MTDWWVISPVLVPQCSDAGQQEEHLAHKKLVDEVLARLSVWSKEQMTCIWHSWCHCHPIISASVIPEWHILLVPDDPGCLGQRTVNGCSSSQSITTFSARWLWLLSRRLLCSMTHINSRTKKLTPYKQQIALLPLLGIFPEILRFGAQTLREFAKYSGNF